MDMKKVLIVGNYGAGNIGDEAILQSLINLCKQNSLSPTVISANPKETNRLHNVPAVPPIPCGIRSFFSGTLNQTKRAYLESDAVILGGGGLFTDERWRAPFIWGVHAFASKLSKKPLYCLGQSVGPLKSKHSRKIALHTFSHAQEICVRDHKSYELLLEIGIPSEKIQIASDLALLLPQQKSSYDCKKKIIVSLRHWNKKEKSILSHLAEVLPNFAHEIALLPMGDNDLDLLLELKHKLNIPAEVLRPNNPSELLNALNNCSLTIGMRLHSLILSSVQGIPCVGLSYSDKVASFCTEAGIEHEEIEDLTVQNLTELIAKAKYDAEKIAHLREKTEHVMHEIFAKI